MIGRGIDQIQSSSVHPGLFEPSITSAGDYVRLAERANGAIPRPVAPGYVWGAALDDIDAFAPDARIVNLETAVTTSPARWPAKDILYRAHPKTSRSSARVAARLSLVRRPRDVVVASVHWGPNWGYEVSEEQRWLAHELVDVGGVDIVHGHSSHHPLGIELYHERLILHGCGDFITNYEGIAGHEEFRNDLVLAYVPTIDAASGRLLGLAIIPFQLWQFRLRRPEPRDVVWLRDALDRHSRPFGARVELLSDGSLSVRGDRLPASRR